MGSCGRMSAHNNEPDHGGSSPALKTPTWAQQGAPPEVLVVDGQVTDIPLWRARKRKERNTGLLGTDGLHGALWIERCNWIHTFGMRYDIDVVYINRHGLVVAVATTPRRRLGRPRFTAHSVIELEAGTASILGLHLGTTLTTT